MYDANETEAIIEAFKLQRRRLLLGLLLQTISSINQRDLPLYFTMRKASVYSNLL